MLLLQGLYLAKGREGWKRPLSFQLIWGPIWNSIFLQHIIFSTACGRGVRHGDPLSPLLFVMTIDEDILRSAIPDLGFNLDGCSIPTLAYADDLILSAGRTAAWPCTAITDILMQSLASLQTAWPGRVKMMPAASVTPQISGNLACSRNITVSSWSPSSLVDLLSR